MHEGGKFIDDNKVNPERADLWTRIWASESFYFVWVRFLYLFWKMKSHIFISHKILTFLVKVWNYCEFLKEKVKKIRIKYRIYYAKKILTFLHFLHRVWNIIE